LFAVKLESNSFSDRLDDAKKDQARLRQRFGARRKSLQPVSDDYLVKDKGQ
jgi:hypothetical protein